MKLNTLRNIFAPAPSRRSRHLFSFDAFIAAQVETLEDRLLLYVVTGAEWSETNVSFSYLPDGTSTSGYESSLYAMLDSIAPTEVWQREFARALQTWSNVSSLNFHAVLDDGSSSGTSGSAQGDSRFGDIRLGAHPLSGYVAWAYFPSSSNTIGGDITLDPSFNLQIGGYPDLYSILLHESGHALGLNHSTSGTVMYGTITAVYPGLTADDIAGIQAIYGARQADGFDAFASNDTLFSATAMNVDNLGSSTFTADLTSLSDVDYYSFVTPTSFDGSLSVSVDTSNLSLLASNVSVYDSSGNLVGTADVGRAYGTTATLNLSGLVAGETYTVMVDGASNDEFGMGAYVLKIQFGGVSEPTPEPDPEPTPEPTPEPAPEPTISADRFEANDTMATATNLGRTNSFFETGLTLHTNTDSDYFTFVAHKSGTFNFSASPVDAGLDLIVTIYDAQQNILASGISQTVSVSMNSGEQYFVQVSAADGNLGTYDLTANKTGGGGENSGTKKGIGNGKGKGKGGGAEIGDGTSLAQFEQQNEFLLNQISSRDFSTPKSALNSSETSTHNSVNAENTQVQTRLETDFGVFHFNASILSGTNIASGSDEFPNTGEKMEDLDATFALLDEMLSEAMGIE